jgi:putative transcriptional regulator
VESYQGRALVASPYLTDPNFMRSVLYLIRHDDEGAMGLVLNRPLSTSIGQLLGELTESTIENEPVVRVRSLRLPKCLSPAIKRRFSN